LILVVAALFLAYDARQAIQARVAARRAPAT
jgi:hypothetical protein